MATLTKLGVCSDGVRRDHLMVLGVSNPNNTQYYSSPSHLSFTPSQTAGLTTELTAFYGASVSFPLPPVGQTFSGSSSNWYTFNFAKNIASDAFNSFPDTSVSSLLTDPTTQKVYDADPLQAQDFDLSTSTPATSASNKIKQLRTALGLDGFYVSDIGVFDGVYYGILTQAKFSTPYGVAAYDESYNIQVYVANNGDNKVKMVAASGYPEEKDWSFFGGPNSIAVGKKGSTCDGKIYVTDTGGTDGVREFASWSVMAADSYTTSVGSDLHSPFGVAIDSLTTCDAFVANSDVPTANGAKKVLKITPNPGSTTTAYGTSVPAGTTGDPYFSSVKGVAVDKNGVVYVADTNNNLIRKIATSANGGGVTSIGTSATPAFVFPQGVAVDYEGNNLYVADTGNNLVRKITLATGAVVSLGVEADPAFSAPTAVAVDDNGNLYVADTGNNLVRKIDKSTGELTTRVGVMTPARLFSFDTKTNGWNPTGFQVSSILWAGGGRGLDLQSGQLSPVHPVDTSQGRCRSLEAFKESRCFLLVHSEVSGSRLYLEFVQYKYVNPRISVDSTRIVILNPAIFDAVTHFKIDAASTTTGSRQLWGVVKVGTVVVLFTSKGAFQDTPDQTTGLGALVSPAMSKYNSLVTATGTTVLDGSVIPGSSPRYLLLLIQQKGVSTMYTYDTTTDLYIVTPSGSPAAAATNYMIAYTYGVCDSKATSSLVELTFSNDYSNQCQAPSTGLYYQSPNQYFTIPYACLGIAYDKLLTDCADIAANMKALVASTCAASIPKVCQTQYQNNPPFACSLTTYPGWLTVISLSASNTMAIAGVLATIVAVFLKSSHPNYVPTHKEVHLINDKSLLPATGVQGSIELKSKPSAHVASATATSAAEGNMLLLSRLEEISSRLERIEKRVDVGTAKVHVT